ncbi:MAG: hypothetical protein ABI889_03240 [Gemmatimonadota bacterium]
MSSSSHEMPAVGTPFIILGADAVLAALPASPVQLAHACLALGFQLAAPATWGDELIAESCLEQLEAYEHPTAVMCSCPMVTERLTRASTTLEPFMLTFVSPPAATARYLRAAYEGQTLHITYAGACPGASDASIDARLRPAELLDAFTQSGIVVGDQPRSFDALVPLDRRRFFSLPGGAPARDHVERVAQRALIELAGDDVVLELTQQMFEQTPALVDLAVPLGCACAGAGEHALRGKPRAGLLMLEPPRARQKVLDPSLRIDVVQPLSQAMTLCTEGHAEEPAPLEVQLSADAPLSNDTLLSSDAAPSDIVAAAGPSVSHEAAIAIPSAGRRCRVILRSSAAVPRYATKSGELVPRASLAVVHRALTRIAARVAMRQPKLERTRRDIASEIHESSSRTGAHTPRPLALAADLPRPVPPPPARYRPRAMLEL